MSGSPRMVRSAAPACVQSSGDPAMDEAVVAIIASQTYARQPEGMPHRISFRTSGRPA